MPHYLLSPIPHQKLASAIRDQLACTSVALSELVHRLENVLREADNTERLTNTLDEVWGQAHHCRALAFETRRRLR